MLKLTALIIGLMITGCTHDPAWVDKKTRHGGFIGYSRSTFRDNEKAVVRAFKKAAKEVCGQRRWDIVREIIPAPGGAVSAIRNAGRGDTSGAVGSARGALINDALYRSGRRNKKVKVTYGSPFKTWNTAELKCRRQR